MKNTKKFILLATLLTMFNSGAFANTEYIHDDGGYGYMSSSYCATWTPAIAVAVLVAIAAAALIAENSSTHTHSHD